MFSAESKVQSPWCEWTKKSPKKVDEEWAGLETYTLRKFKWKSENQGEGHVILLCRSGIMVRCDLPGSREVWAEDKLALVEITLPLPSARQMWSSEIFQTPPAVESGCCCTAAHLDILNCFRWETHIQWKKSHGVGSWAQGKAWLLGVRCKDQQRGHRLRAA